MAPLNSPLASPDATRDVLGAFGVELKKSLGQNFLVDDNVVGKIVELAQIESDDVVLEVGPGIGTLTLALVKAAAGVVSIERDQTLAPVLAQTAGAHDNFALVMCDALDVDAAQIHAAVATINRRTGAPDARAVMPTMLVANLPYAVAATVIYDFFERFETLESATVMVQKEVADRICASPGSKDYGAYTVGLSLMTRPAGRFDVAPGCFMPPPHVTSTVIRLVRHVPLMPDGSTPSAEVIKAAAFAAKAAFSQRRKTIRNSMRSYLSGCGLDAALLDEVFEQCGVSPATRGETLAVSTYLMLGSELLKRAMTPSDAS